MRRFARALSIGILAGIPVLAAAPTAFASTVSHSATTSRITSVSPEMLKPTWHWAQYSSYMGLLNCQEAGLFYATWPNVQDWQCIYAGGLGNFAVYQLWLYIYI